MDCVRDGQLEAVREMIYTYGLSHRSEWSNGYTLLLDALQNGHMEVAKLLLANGCEINSKGGQSIPSTSPLHLAKGNLEVFKMLLEKGADINAIDKYGNTPLHLPVVWEEVDPISTYKLLHVAKSNVEVVKMLLEKGANVNAINEDGDTPLHVAVIRERVDITALLVAYGACVNTRNKRGKMPIHIALHWRRSDIAEHLLNHGADVNAGVCASYDVEGYIGYTPLHFAVDGMCEEIVNLLLDKGASVNVIGDGVTPLHIAAGYCQSRIVDSLLKNGADVHCLSTATLQGGCTTLHYAVETGNEETVKILLDNGASVNVKFEGKTPLHLAAEKGHSGIVDSLLKHGADMHCLSSGYSEGTPLHFAVEEGYEEVVNLLLSKGASVNVKGQGQTPLHLAVEEDHYGIADILLKNGADVHCLTTLYTHMPMYRYWTKPGYTALHYATQNGNEELVKLLLSEGAGVNLVGQGSALHIAVQSGHEEIARTLLEFGANVDAHDIAGKTVLLLAVENHEEIMVDIILKHFPNVNNESNRRSLITAVHANSMKDIIKSLHQYGFNLSLDDINNSELLFNAIKEGYVGIVESLLKLGADANKLVESKSTSYRDTPLHVAVINKQEEVAQILLEHQVDVNAQGSTGKPPIIYAAKNVDLKIMKLLLSSGASIPSELLLLAVKNNSREIVEFLLEFGADLHYKDENGETALYATAMHYSGYGNNGDHVRGEIAKLLLRSGADVNAQSNSGYLPIHAAADNGFASVVEALLEHGANANSKCKSHRTPLRLAVYNDHFEVIKILLKVGAFVDLVDDSGRTVLHHVSERSNDRIIEALLYNGSDVNITDRDNFTPLDLAAKSCYHDDSDDLLEELYRYDSDDEDSIVYTYRDCWCCIALGLLKHHTIKLKTANLYVSPKNLASLKQTNTLISVHYTRRQLMDIQNECTKELELLKCTSAGDTKHSLFYILTKSIHHLAILLENEKLMQYATSNNLKEKFPEYGRLICSHLSMAKQRRNILEEAYGYAIRIFSRLNLNCIQLIIAYLSHQDLLNLIHAYQPNFSHER